MNIKKILVVEDEIITAEHLKNELIEAGYDVHVEYEGEQAVKIINEGYKPDLIVMDVKLRSLMDGVQAAELIKIRYNIPVIFLTAYLSNELIERAKYASPYMYIAKPYKVEELLAAIQATLQKYEEHENLSNVVSSSFGKHIQKLENDICGVQEEVGSVKATVKNIREEINNVNNKIQDIDNKVVSTASNIVVDISNMITSKFKDFFGDPKDHILDHAYIRDLRDASKATISAIRKSTVGIIIGAVGVIFVMGFIAWIKYHLMMK